MHVERVQPAFVDPAEDPLQRGVLGRILHLVECRLLLLEAVRAGQIARQRRHQRDVHGPGDAIRCPVEVCA